jgi:serine/threonine protein kinase
LKVLGEGGMGVVYLAWHPDLATEVALKVIKQPAATPGFLHQLSREVQAMGDIRHPNVVSVFDAGIWISPRGPRAYYVMESLRPPFRLDSPLLLGRLDLFARGRLLADAARGLAAAHLRGIIHADVKPHNILVEDRAGVFTPKIADFGLARVVTAWGERPDPSCGGTSDYLAPELLDRAGREPDTRSDVYAFGVTMHEVLAGHRPQHGQPLADPGDAELRAILTRALAADPAQRFTNAVELADALDAWCEDPLGRLLASLRRWAKDRRPIAVLLCILVAGLFAFGAGIPFSRSSWVNQALLPLTAVASSPPPRDTKFVIVDLADREQAAASLQGMPDLGDIDTSDPLSMRKVHGVLAEKLAKAGASAVGWDIIYVFAARTPNENARLIQGLTALAETTPLTLAAHQRVWSSGRDSGALDPEVWDVLHPLARLAVASPSPVGPVVTLATKVPDADPVEAFPLSIAFRRADADELRLRFSSDRDQCLVYVGKRGVSADAREGVGRLVARIPISSFEYGPMSPDQAVELNFPLATEELAIPVLSINRDDWKSLVIPAHRVLTMSDRELRAFAHAIIIVCDTRRDVKDFGSGPVEGGFVQAATVASLLQRAESLRTDLLRVPQALPALAIAILAAGWGSILYMLALGLALNRARHRGLLMLGALLLALAGALLACRASAAWGRMLIHPLPILWAVLTSWATLSLVFPSRSSVASQKEVRS